jgi:hypothetical protein
VGKNHQREIMMRHFRLAVRVATALAMLAALVITAPSATAANGGCNNPPITANGWTGSACSSDDGTWVSGDMYIDIRGTYNSSCRVRWEQYHNGNKVTQSPYEGCYLGRHNADVRLLKAPGNYWTKAYIWADGHLVWSATSPVTN